MPSTRENLVQLQYDTGWNIEGERGLLPLYNEVHRYMVSGDCFQHIYVDPSTGLPPVISTTTPTRRYNAPTNCRRIFDVAIDGLTTASGSILSTSYNRNNGFVKSPETFTFGGKEFIRMNVASNDALYGVLANYTFPFDPLTTSDTYYLFYYFKPTEILSTTIQAQVPEQHHDILLDGVRARVGKKQYGSGDAYEYWKYKVVPRLYWKEMNAGAQQKTFFVTQRPC